MCAVLALPATAGAHSLTYGPAKAAAQRAGNVMVGKAVRVSTVVRLSYAPGHTHEYGAKISWTQVNPTGCEQCLEDEDGRIVDGPINEECIQYLRLTVRSSRSLAIAVSAEPRTCLEERED